MADAFGVERVSKGAVKTILFGSRSLKPKKMPSPPKVSPLTGEPIRFNPRSTTKVQHAKWGRNAVRRSQRAQARRKMRLSQNTPFFPKQASSGPPAPPKKWYQKRSNQAMMGGGAVLFGGAGYAGYKKGQQPQ